MPKPAAPTPTAPPGGAVTVTADSPAEPATQRGAARASRCAPPSAVWVLIAGAVGLAAALTLTIEKIEILINPDYVPSCSINPVLSCGSVMITPQASAFGFPNPLIGIVSLHRRRRHRRAGGRQSPTAAVVLGRAGRSARCSASGSSTG